jgi:hypothetical protein
MSDDRADYGVYTASGGLIDVHGYSIDELAAVMDEPGMSRALDHILTVSDNSAGFHGFTNSI